MAEQAFPDEVVHLKKTMKSLEEALCEAKSVVEQIDRDYTEAKRYMADYRSELDPHEMFQNEQELKRIDQSGAFSVSVWERLMRLQDSPYFGRIDFRTDDYEESDSYYIGRFSFRHKKQMLIFDWRAPISSMFYECELGAAAYQAPSGPVEGELTRKRQYKIRDSRLEYTIESSVNIRDEVLQKELSHNSDEKMKSIIATIQKEQNRIIRNEQADVLIIQGVAGSGKTSVALHRIAYLLYRSRDRLTSQNIMILSPNRVFGDYISNVLPELGEEPVFEWSFAEAADIQMERVIHFEADRPPLETEDPGWAERVRFKSTLQFLWQMDEYIRLFTKEVFEPTDYQPGRQVIKADWIRKRYLAYEHYPVKCRLQMVAEDIFDRLETDNIMEEVLPRPKAIERVLKRMLNKQTTLEAYRDFYKWLNRPDLLAMPNKKTLEWADVYPFLYLHAAFEGVVGGYEIKHLIIDEMQDYTPIQYAAISRLFPCAKTILGDYGQSLNPNHQHGIDDICAVYPQAELIYLNKSYRSTYEIISFAKRIKKSARLEAVERHGEIPAVIRCCDKIAEIRALSSMVEAFSGSGSASLGIIVKTNEGACSLYEQLAALHEVHLILPESMEFKNGVSVMSVQMSKGLEFDAVIMPFCDKETYNAENDRNLLYIGATRAMHQLTLLYSGEVSELLRGVME